MRAWRKTYAHLDEEGVTGARRVAPGAAEQHRDPRARRGRYDGVTPDAPTPIISTRTLLPLASSCRPPGTGATTGRGARFVLDPRPLPSPTPPPRSSLRATSRRSARPAGATSPPGRARRSGTSPTPGSACPPCPTETGKKGMELLDLPDRPAPAAGREPAPALPRPLGPAAARLRRPRPDHPPRDPAAEADAQRRPHRHRRRPRGRQLDDGRRPPHHHAPHRPLTRGTQRHPRGGAARPRAAVRARAGPPRGGGGGGGGGFFFFFFFFFFFSIFVHDQDEALDFYVNKLGIELKTDQTLPDGFRWLTVSPKGQRPRADPDEPRHRAVVDGGGPRRNPVMQKRGVFGAGVLSTADCRKTYEELSPREWNSRRKKDQFYAIEAILKDRFGNWISTNSTPGRLANGR